MAEAEELEDSTRQLAAEFLVTLAEAREKAPGMLRKLPAQVARLFQCLVTFLLDIEVRRMMRLHQKQITRSHAGAAAQDNSRLYVEHIAGTTFH